MEIGLRNGGCCSKQALQILPKRFLQFWYFGMFFQSGATAQLSNMVRGYTVHIATGLDRHCRELGLTKI